MKAAPLYVSGVVGALIGIGVMVAGGCANEQQKKGHELYGHYCSHCHGDSGRQNEGYNWSSMPDPKPKDLTNKSEMSTLKDKDIFERWRNDTEWGQLFNRYVGGPITQYAAQSPSAQPRA